MYTYISHIQYMLSVIIIIIDRDTSKYGQELGELRSEPPTLGLPALPTVPLNTLCVYWMYVAYSVDHQHFPIHCTHCVWLSKSMWHCVWASVWIHICLCFAWEDSTPSSLLHTSVYTYSTLFSQQRYRLSCDTLSAFSSHPLWKHTLTLSVLHQQPRWSKTLTLQLNLEQAPATIVPKAYALCLFLDSSSVCGCVCY